MLPAPKYLFNGREERVVLTEICRTLYIHGINYTGKESSVSKAVIISGTPMILGAGAIHYCKVQKKWAQ